MKIILIALSILFLIPIIFFSCTTKPQIPLNTVVNVDLNKYLGTWYEIARLPNSFQKNCESTTATYSIRADGYIKVFNQCKKDSINGELKTATGKAWIVDKINNSKLKVQFFWPFSGKYWIIDLDKNYKYTVVSEPKRKYLWILSRTPSMDEDVYQNIIKKLESWHFDTNKLIVTKH